MNIIELPEAFDWHKQPMTGWYGPVYTKDQMLEYAALVRTQALEEAAGVCDDTLAQHYMKQVIPTHDEALLLAACADCAAAIRVLKGKNNE